MRERDEAVLAHLREAEFVASADAAAALVERCGGNPLYAEEYARLLADRASEVAVDLAMPETVRSLIGARIDSLPGERKALLHDAAVVGQGVRAQGPLEDSKWVRERTQRAQPRQCGHAHSVSL